ncbi:MAG TPA: hypothetical protein VK971_09445 [Thiohalobacter sp.]|nr:hypothetical protein [Thiohalobacter sp.]
MTGTEVNHGGRDQARLRTGNARGRLAVRTRQGRLTRVFGARDGRHNNAVVLMQDLRMLGAR